MYNKKKFYLFPAGKAKKQNERSAAPMAANFPKALCAFRTTMLSIAVAAAVFFGAGAAATAQNITEEATYTTGRQWYIVNNPVDYFVSDNNVAEIINDNGVQKVWFKRPGDVYITVRNRDNGSTAVYLMHIVGHAVDETAVNRGTFAQEILDLVNAERQKAKLQPLRLSDDLIRGASIRAMEQVKRFSHTRPNGTQFYTVLVRGPNYVLGENVAVGQSSPQEVMKDWMNSPGHRQNILNPQYKELGVGYCYRADSKYRHHWAQLFRR